MYTTEFEHVVQGSTAQSSQIRDYPTNSVIGVLPNATAAMGAIRTLRSSGFLRSEVRPLAGLAAADALHAHAGHGRLIDAVLRVAERLGIVDEEMELKAGFEAALRDGSVLVLVAAPTDERRDLATSVLRDGGASSVHVMGRFTITDVPVRTTIVDDRSAA